MGGAQAIVVTLVGGIAVLLQVRVMVDNQSNRTATLERLVVMELWQRE